MSTGTFRLYKNDIEKLKIAAASSGKEEKEILHEILSKAVPEDVGEELLRVAKARSPLKKTRGTETVQVQPTSTATNIGERLKSVIADAVETKVYLKTLGISLGDEPKQQYPYGPYGYQYPPQTPQQPEQKRDIMAFVAELKALDSLDKNATDPEIKSAIKELKDAQIKALEQPKQPPQASSRDRMRELIEMMTFYKMAGQPEEASKVAEVLRTEISKMQTQLHDTEKSLLTATSDFKISRLEQKIDEIRNAPTELQQITHLSKLAEDDPAIKAYMNKKLGIKEKGEPLTPEKLGKYIQNIKVPLGEMVKGVWDFIQQRQAPSTQPPPPPGMEAQQQLITPEEEAEIAERALPRELLEKPKTGKSMSTFAEPEPITETSTLPEEAHLPPEPEETPPPPKKTETKKPKPKGEKKE